MSDDETTLPTAQAGDTPGEWPAPRPRRNWLVALPLVLFGGLAAVFLYQLVSGHDPQQIPSVLIGKTAPQTVLPALENVSGPDGQPMPGLDLTGVGDGRPVLVNVFASWCGPCRDEHPLLMELARDDRFRLVAINYKDKPENARQFLQSLGNPYAAIGVDQKGSATIDWGVYGVPESFLVAPDGEIVFKQTGPFTPQAVETGLLPALERTLAREAGGTAPTS
ncbi:DsbE family thiol:disulfide interchange protein [Aurantimonas sp. A2-1-M11]|uniref:DsbE family thiol:disulfide interchange protein n=1 Tax=Aurantimonas sp. A2-1-M11 TaxID=3113712 RepID=UPI002F9432E8